MQKQSFIKSTLRKFGVEIKKSAFGLVLEEDLKSLNQKRPFRTVFDIGANEGQTSLHFNEMFPQARIFSFEPSSQTFEKLKANVQGIPQITPIRTAVGTTEGSVTFKNTGSSVNSSILDYLNPIGEDMVCNEEEVPLRTVPSICEEHKLAGIDLLKIDTQGYDLHVMKGAESLLKAHKVGVILTEVIMVQMYDGQAWFHDVCTYLHELGFRLCCMHGINREGDPFIHWADAVFVDPEYKG